MTTPSDPHDSDASLLDRLTAAWTFRRSERVAHVASSVALALLIVLSATAPFVMTGFVATTSAASADTTTIAGGEFGDGTNNDTSSTGADSEFDNAVVQEQDILNGNAKEKSWVIKRSSDDWVLFTTNQSATPDRIQKFTSTDGKTWSRAGKVEQSGVKLQDPSVVKHDGTWYLYAENATGEDSIQIFKSSDLSNWQYVEEWTSSNAPQSPVAHVHDGKVYLFYEKYNGQSCTSGSPCTVRYATSTDGTSFTDQGTVWDKTDTSIPDDIWKADGKWHISLHGSSDGQHLVADSIGGTYESVGTIPDTSSLKYNSNPHVTLVNDENGDYAGPTNGKPYFYIWEGGSPDSVQFATGEAAGGLRLDGAHETGDTNEWNVISNPSATQSVGTDAAVGDYAQKIDTVSGTDSTWSGEYNYTLPSTYSPSETTYWVKLPSKDTDKTTFETQFQTSDGSVITGIAFDHPSGNEVNVIDGASSSGAGDYPGGTYVPIRIKWDWGSDSFELIINGTSRGTFSFRNSVSGMDVIEQRVDYSGNAYTIKVDNQYPPLSSAGKHKSKWYDYGSSTTFSSFSSNETLHGGSVTYEFRGSSDGTISGATSWYGSISNVPESRYLQVRTSLSGSTGSSPEVHSYTIPDYNSVVGGGGSDGKYEETFVLEDHTENFQDDSELTVYEYNGETTITKSGTGTGTAITTSDWLEYAGPKSFNHNDRSFVRLYDGDWYKYEVRDGSSFYEQVGDHANETDGPTYLVIGEPTETATATENGTVTGTPTPTISGPEECEFQRVDGGVEAVCDFDDAVSEFDYSIIEPDGDYVYNGSYDFDEPTDYYEGELSDPVTDNISELPDGDVQFNWSGEYENGTAFNGSTSLFGESGSGGFGSSDGGGFGFGGPTGKPGDASGTQQVIAWGLLAGVGYAGYRRFSDGPTISQAASKAPQAVSKVTKRLPGLGGGRRP